MGTVSSTFSSIEPTVNVESPVVSGTKLLPYLSERSLPRARLLFLDMLLMLPSLKFEVEKTSNRAVYRSLKDLRFDGVRSEYVDQPKKSEWI